MTDSVKMTLQCRYDAWMARGRRASSCNRITVTRAEVAGLADSQVRALRATLLDQLSAREIGFFNSSQIMLLVESGVLLDKGIRPMQVKKFIARLKAALNDVLGPEDGAKRYQYARQILERALERRKQNQTPPAIPRGYTWEIHS